MADQQINLKISADPSGGIAGLNQFSSRLKRLEGESGGIVGKIKSHWMGFAAAIGGGLAVSKLVEFGKQAVNAADSLNKLSQSTGTTVEQLSGYVYAAELADVSQESLGTGLKKLSRNMMDAASGTGEAKDAFEAMGVSVKNADGTLKNAGQVLEDVADRFASYEDGAAKTALAMKIFGRSGADMIPLLNAGAEGIRKAAQEAGKFGRILDKETAQAAENFNDNLTRLGSVAQGFANSVMRQVLPSLEQYTDRIIKSAKESDTFEKAAKNAGETLVSVAEKAEIIINLGSKIPPQFLEAGSYGLIGMLLFGGKAGALIATLTLVNDLASKSLGFGVQDFGKKNAGATQSMQNIWDAITGKRDWNTGEWKPGYGPAIGVDYEPHGFPTASGKKTAAPLLAGTDAKKIAAEYANAAKALQSFQDRIDLMDPSLSQWEKQEQDLVQSAAELIWQYEKFPDVAAGLQKALEEGLGFIELDRQMTQQKEAAEDAAKAYEEMSKNIAEQLQKELDLKLRLISVDAERALMLTEYARKELELQHRYGGISSGQAAGASFDLDVRRLEIVREQLALEIQARSEKTMNIDDEAGLLELMLREKAVQEEINQLLRLRGLIMKEHTGTFFEGMEAGLEKLLDEWGNMFKQGEDLAIKTAVAMRDGFSDIFFKAMKGEIRSMEDLFKGLADMANSVLDAIYKKLADMAANYLISQLFGTFFGVGSGVGAAASSGANSMWSGIELPAYGYAKGGETSAHRPILVGEEGPEIFVPSTSGTVVPNGAALSISVPVTIGNNDKLLAGRLQRNIEETVRRTIKEYS